MDITEYNKTREFHKEIEPLVCQLKDLCAKHSIPMFMAFAIKNSEEGTVYDYEMLMAASRRKLKENQINSLVLSVNDFDVNYPEAVNNAISVLEHFLHHNDDVKTLDVCLKDDVFPGFENISEGAEVSLPEKYCNPD